MLSPRVLTVADIKQEMAKIGVDLYGIKLMADKADLLVIKIEKVDHRAANILKQEMLSLGGETACAREVMALKQGSAPALLIGTPAQYRKLIFKLQYQPFSLKELAARIKNTIDNYFRQVKKVQLMGILNVTPDSFFDGGKYLDSGLAVSRALEMVKEGADIIDIGGESSRPGSTPVSAREELARILPIVKALAKKTRVPISIDTYKSEVAAACLAQGARIINDISALRFDRRMAKVVVKYKAKVVLMHMQGTPRQMQKNPHYQDVVSEVFQFLEERIQCAASLGIARENIIIDPGIGFGKTLGHNLVLLQKLAEFRSLGAPVLLGISRKSMIGNILGHVPGERLNGSLAAAAWGYFQGASILRVHDVAQTKELLKVLEAIKRGD
ncbi:MAG: dihydropteroate synthase [bacterium]|nr:dihydropteroate synthase [bacterium]MDD5353875.1 dihydropteroate synthase [bacterium]MDD5756370.1 dihydropteroate synthase [bacterium]